MEDSYNQSKEIMELKEQIEKLTSKIELLSLTIEKLSKTTNRMDDHIDFVEKTYDRLRSPLSYICGKKYLALK